MPNPNATNDNLMLHQDLNPWATDPSRPIFQGGLCLHDNPIGGGGFFCIPGMHTREELNRYKNDYRNGKFGVLQIPKEHKNFNEFRDVEMTKSRKIEVPMEKGDFVIWNSNLPHTGGLNTLPNHWRLQAFVRFIALDGPTVNKKEIQKSLEYRKMAAQSMRTGKTPEKFFNGGSIKKTDMEVASHKAPELTKLGRKIWGQTPW
eukprot:TRINITY_DN5751_c0_g1_i1.p1 TRINITY_DN5751_c0_g1~~TRINITY_DN5751_c0_g1_i1.p1  ORF type:complete len:203 (+),score=52.71 TRINITY_DN5751_c0_g1_i1:440-1048(+)